MRNISIYIRVDASYEIGSGHVMRCLALAMEIRKYGGDVKFFSVSNAGNLNKYIIENGFSVYEFTPLNNLGLKGYEQWLGCTQKEDAKKFINAIGNDRPDWVIIDHYAIDKIWEDEVRPYASRVMVIDDLANREHNCDVLLDQNYIHNSSRYDDLLPPSTIKLLGPHYALLRDEFNNISFKNHKEMTTPIKRAFIFFGGTDCDNLTFMALKLFERSGLDHLKLDVVIGSSNRFYEQIKRYISNNSNIKLYVQINNISKLMLEADIALGAGGSTTWERMAAGLPSIIITTAENQEAFTKDLSQDGYLTWVGNSDNIDENNLYNTILKLVKQPNKLLEQSRKGIKLVDGNGTGFCAKWLTILNNKNTTITILSDKETWMKPFIREFISGCKIAGINIHWVNDPSNILCGDMCFILSCSQLLSDNVLKLNKHNLVVHASDLPAGKGWSPLSWNILEGNNEITVTLFEAEKKVDNGFIYIQDKIKFRGDELLNELHSELGKSTINLCTKFIEQYPHILQCAQSQSGKESFYPKRTSNDSQLDPNKSLGEQFNLLRIVDNERYPAFFDWKGCRYYLKIEKNT